MKKTAGSSNLLTLMHPGEYLQELITVMMTGKILFTDIGIKIIFIRSIIIRIGQIIFVSAMRIRSSILIQICQDCMCIMVSLPEFTPDFLQEESFPPSIMKGQLPHWF